MRPLPQGHLWSQVAAGGISNFALTSIRRTHTQVRPVPCVELAVNGQVHVNDSASAPNTLRASLVMIQRFGQTQTLTVQPPPESPRSALADKLLGGALSSIPIAGGVAAAWYQNLMEGPYSRRLEGWRRDITEVVNDLATRYDGLLDDETFLDSFVKATRAAQATHQREKLDALKGAIWHSVGPNAPDEYEQDRFIRLIDQFVGGT